MAKDKFQRSRLTFQQSSLILKSHNIKSVVSETSRPIELKFHIETPQVERCIFITNFNGHMTKMAAMLI